MPSHTKRKRKIEFTEICPLGYTVVLDKNCWLGHILRKTHPTMGLRRGDIIETIKKPDKILEKRTLSRRELVYYKSFPGKDPFNRYLKVATWVADGSKKITEVRTAHPINSIYGGKQIWPRQV